MYWSSSSQLRGPESNVDVGWACMPRMGPFLPVLPLKVNKLNSRLNLSSKSHALSVTREPKIISILTHLLDTKESLLHENVSFSPLPTPRRLCTQAKECEHQGFWVSAQQESVPQEQAESWRNRPPRFAAQASSCCIQEEKPGTWVENSNQIVRFLAKM